MTTFATEFPISSSPSTAAFAAQVVTWLRGNDHSQVLETPNADLDSDAAHLRVSTGEELRVRSLALADGSRAHGFRHDLPDDAGRLWRTEAVLRSWPQGSQVSLLRIRTECVALIPTATLGIPRKPYIIKTVLKDGWGGDDALLQTTDQPLWLSETEADLGLARSITAGEAADFLPVVYVSSLGRDVRAIDKHATEKLAFDLGGVAHVVVEPSRAFSFELRSITDERNVYGGAVGIIIPNRGVVRRIFSERFTSDTRQMIDAISQGVIDFRSAMPATGWDWAQLQEAALRQQREREKSRLTAEESEALYREEIQTLQDQIRNLNGQLASPALIEEVDSGQDNSLSKLLDAIGPEVYPGESLDRIRLAASIACKHADADGLDNRSKFVLGQIAAVPSSAALSGLLDEIKRATKDGTRLAADLGDVLEKCGYAKKSDSKHIRFEAQKSLKGLDSLTVAKTPSDHRGLINMKAQVERTLGLRYLKS